MGQSRPSSISASSLTAPTRHSTSRNHSHSVSLGTFNPTHRVTRRKSMTSNAANLSAVAAVIKGMDESSYEALPSFDGRTPIARSLTRPEAEYSVGDHRQASSSYSPYTPISHKGSKPVQGESARGESAIVDEQSMQEHSSSVAKARARRASEGAHLTKMDKRTSSGELKCEKCGKGYKHSSCLTKHLLVLLNSILSTKLSLCCMVPGIDPLYP
jgi:hypothetical protein